MASGVWFGDEQYNCVGFFGEQRRGWNAVMNVKVVRVLFVLPQRSP